jgi:hypothetical protein
VTVRPRYLVLFVVGGLAIAIAGGALVAVFISATKSTQIRDQQETNSPLIKNSNQTLEIIQGCTTPGRDCYERGQTQLRSAITDINRVSVIAASCASGPRKVTVQDIQACVISRLATKH